MWVKNTYIYRKHLSWCPLQKPLAAISRRAPSCVFAVALVSCSPVSVCRSGSTETSWHTSVNSFAVRSRISLCLMEGNPPVQYACENDVIFILKWLTLNEMVISYASRPFNLHDRKLLNQK